MGRTRAGEQVRMQTSDEQVPVHTTEKDSTDRERVFAGDDYCLCMPLCFNCEIRMVSMGDRF